MDNEVKEGFNMDKDGTFLRLRGDALTQLRTPCADLQEMDAFLPFTLDNYSHIHTLDTMSREWQPVHKYWANPATKENPWPYACSTTRPDGLEVWDRAAAIPACVWRVIYDTAYNALPCRNINAGFEDTLKQLLRAGPVAKGLWRRPKGEFILDLPAYRNKETGITGWDLLVMAEVMAQHELLQVPRGPLIGERIRMWMARIHISMTFDIPVFDGQWDVYSQGDMFYPYGILVTTAAKADKPVYEVKLTGPTSMVPDSTVAVVGVGFNYGKLPSGFSKGTFTHNHSTRWSCSPITSVITGWEYVDVVCHMPMSQIKSTYILNNNDLLSAKSLGSLIQAGIAEYGPRKGMRVQELFNSEMYRSLYSCSMPHPPRDGLMIRNDAKLGFVRPKGMMPDGKLSPKNRDHMPWIDYLGTLERIRTLIKDSTEAYERMERIQRRQGRLSITKPEKRQANWNKLNKLVEQKTIYGRKSYKKRREGFITEANRLENEIKKIEAQVAKLVKTQEEVS